MTTTDDHLIKAHADLVYGTCLRITGNAQDAADVSQEVFVAWMQGRGRIRGPLAAWLHATARRRAMDWRRRHHRRAHHEQTAAGSAVVSAEPELEPWQIQLDDCLAQLDPRSRTLVIERHVLGLGQDDIAARWRVSQATVSRQLDRELSRLRKLLERRGVTAASAVAMPEMAMKELLNHSGAACPLELAAPLLAHAQVPGAMALTTAGALTVWWTTWPALIAATLAALLTIAAAGGLVWRAAVLAEQPADLVGTLLERMPTVAPLPLEALPPAGVPRYRSIERLLAMLPPVDEARQERIEWILTANGTCRQWDWTKGPEKISSHYLGNERDLATNNLPTTEESAYLAAIEPLVSEVEQPGAFLNEVGWLARDYRLGHMSSLARLYELRIIPNLLHARAMVCVLGNQTIRSRDPEKELARLDAVCRAFSRYPTTLITEMIAIAVAQIRDDVYLRLALTNRLPATMALHWIGESSEKLTDQMWLAWQGEVLCFQMPLIEDFDRGVDLSEIERGLRIVHDETPPSIRSIIRWAQGPWVRADMLSAAEQCLRLGDSLRGGITVSEIDAAYRGRSHGTWSALMVPNLSESNQMIAEYRLSHAGRRLMAWIVLRHRQGQPLPERLEDVVDAVSDGRSLLGGSAMTYGLRYEKLSEHRFRLELDPHGAVPTYALPERTESLLRNTTQNASAKTNSPPPALTIDRAHWETDVDRLPVGPTIPEPPTDSKPPLSKPATVTEPPSPAAPAAVQ